MTPEALAALARRADGIRELLEGAAADLARMARNGDEDPAAADALFQIEITIERAIELLPPSARAAKSTIPTGPIDRARMLGIDFGTLFDLFECHRPVRVFDPETGAHVGTVNPGDPLGRGFLAVDSPAGRRVERGFSRWSLARRMQDGFGGRDAVDNIGDRLNDVAALFADWKDTEWWAHHEQTDRLERAWMRFTPYGPVNETETKRTEIKRRIANALEAVANAGGAEAIGRMVIDAIGGCGITPEALAPTELRRASRAAAAVGTRLAKAGTRAKEAAGRIEGAPSDVAAALAEAAHHAMATAQSFRKAAKAIAGTDDGAALSSAASNAVMAATRASDAGQAFARAHGAAGGAS